MRVCEDGCLRILIDARLTPGVDGGVQQVVEGLAGGFARFPGPDMSYTFLSRHPAPPGLTEVVSSEVSILEVDGVSVRPSASRRARTLLKPARAIGRNLVGPLRPLRRPPIEEGGFDVVHLAVQHGYATTRPYVYSPYDLQHLHHPEFFTSGQRRSRDRTYGPLAAGATAIVAHTAWNAHDVHVRLGVERERIFVIPLGVTSPTPPAPEVVHAAVRRFGGTRGGYALYPAQTWPHKNHLGLLACIARLRDAGLSVPVICTGRTNEHHRLVAKESERLGLDKLVHFVGFVSDGDLRALYAGARCLLFPSLFEGWGMPIFDALASGLPVAATSRCGLGEVLGDAAETFDPGVADQMDRAVRTIWEVDERRNSARLAGLDLTSVLTWDETCRTLGSLYRRVGGCDPIDGDQQRLALAAAWRIEEGSARQG